jgi:hypothetical protein
LAPVEELFPHVLDAREFYAALVASGKVNDVLTLGRGFFARSIEERLRLAGATMNSHNPRRKPMRSQEACSRCLTGGSITG